MVGRNSFDTNYNHFDFETQGALRNQKLKIVRQGDLFSILFILIQKQVSGF